MLSTTGFLIWGRGRPIERREHFLNTTITYIYVYYRILNIANLKVES